MDDRPTWSSAYRHECEVRDCIRRYYPDGGAMNEHLVGVQKRRGKAAADKLRADCRIEWAKKAKGAT